jgi:hypothetical protein
MGKPACMPTLGDYPNWVNIHFTSAKFCTYFPFSKSFFAHSGCAPKATKVPKATMLDRADKHKEKR